jgi:Arc/MetJ-type ribon-helix-helix transcriptional regulator
MEVQLTLEQEALVRHAIESGRLQREEQAVQEALSLWEKRERRRLEILAAVEEAESSLQRGEGRDVPSARDVGQLVKDVKERGLKRLQAEQNSGS